jgi:phosphopantetheine--protein transferase-like protein
VIATTAASPTAPTAVPAFVTGCDVVDVARLSCAIDRRAGLLARVFTDREVADARRGGVRPGTPTERARLAARFAAKEATRKALGDLRLPFHAVEVRRHADGAPQLWVRDAPSTLSCSLSHDGGVALAIVVGLAPAPAPAETTA